MKQAKVIPLFKKGCPLTTSNHRPISLLAVKLQKSSRDKSLLKIAYVTFVILESHEFFPVIFCDFGDF